MRSTQLRSLAVATLALVMLALPIDSRAQQRSDDGIDLLSLGGSALLSLLYVPFKLATCAVTQAMAAVAYTATYGVPGSYEGGTNGTSIGEVARKSCTGDWLITPEQVDRDYRAKRSGSN